MKISELPQATEITGEEILPVVQNGETKKVSRDDLVGAVPDGIRIENGIVTLLSNGETVGESASLPEITIDGTLSTTSENAVSNKVVTEALNGKISAENGSVQSNHLANGSVTEEKLSKEVKIKLNEPQITVDSELSAESENPAQNKAISNSLSNAVKGKVTGEILRIDDISPIPHSLRISVKSESETELTDVTVKQYGKNLLDYHEIKTVGQTVVEIIENGVRITGIRAAKIHNISVKPNTNYTLSFLRKKVTENSAEYVYVQSAAPTVATLKNIFTDTVGTFNTGNTTAINIEFFASRLDTNETVEFTNIQLEPGTQQTEYEPYVPVTEATVSEDGAVEGLTSIYPNTVLVTDSEGVTLECEYNRDLNKVINNIIDAIISLGGNV